MKLRTVLLGMYLTLLYSKVKGQQESISPRAIHESEDGNPPPPTETLWIEQKLDHFDEKENRTWNMRYLANDEFFQDGAPIFILVGGEGPISDSGYIQNSHIHDIAREHHGYLFHTEHRFYGESQPTNDLSTENLKYLNVKQALADLAHFIRTIKTTIPGLAESKVVLVGCSYAGTMVTWFKKLYPDLAVGCWASSAPLHYKMNYFENLEVVGESIREVGGVDCYDRLKNGFTKIQKMFADKRGAEVKAMLRGCDNFDETKESDLQKVLVKIPSSFKGIVKSHYNDTIQNACKTVMEGEDDVSGIFNFIVGEYEKRCKKSENADLPDYCQSGCIGMNNTNTLMNTTFTNGSDRQWTYQTCNEFGIFQTLDSIRQPFFMELPLDYYTDKCKVFGEHYTKEYIFKKVQATNDYFGGLKPNVENVYSTHGSLDPWRVLGVQDDQLATIVPKSSHCMTLKSISDSDTPEMRASKERISQLVREWVGVDRSVSSVSE